MFDLPSQGYTNEARIVAQKTLEGLYNYGAITNSPLMRLSSVLNLHELVSVAYGLSEISRSNANWWLDIRQDFSSGRAHKIFNFAHKKGAETLNLNESDRAYNPFTASRHLRLGMAQDALFALEDRVLDFKREGGYRRVREVSSKDGRDVIVVHIPTRNAHMENRVLAYAFLIARHINNNSLPLDERALNPSMPGSEDQYTLF